MDKINLDPRALVAGNSSKSLSSGSLKLSPEQELAAAETLAAILKGRPETERESPAYVRDMVEVLSELSPEEHGWLRDTREGLAARCKFLPTPADVFELLRDRKAKAEQFKPAHTAYRRLNDEPPGAWDEETDYERKRRVVRELLGYSPGESPPKRELTMPTDDEVKGLKLKTPPGPITPQLRALLESKGWPVLPPSKQDTAA